MEFTNAGFAHDGFSADGGALIVPVSIMRRKRASLPQLVGGFCC